MVYTGWLELGGREIVNAGRTYKYASTLLPNLNVQPCSGCEDLFEVFGDKEYTSPLVDQPAWFDPDNPDSWDFYGLYPLGFEGFENSTVTATVTQFINDGGAISAPRRGTRSMRISGLLIGQTDAAISAGMTWLKQSLRPGSCGSNSTCTGDHMSYFSSCPPLCEDSPELLAEMLAGDYPDTSKSTFVDPGFDAGGGGRVTKHSATTLLTGGQPVVSAKNLITNPTMEGVGAAGGTTVRTNLVLAPRGTTTSGWVYSAGTSETGTTTAVTNAIDGPFLPDGNQSLTYIRRTVTVAKTTGSSGFQIGGVAAIPNTIAAGDVFSASLWIRSSVATTISGFRLQMRSGSTSVGLTDVPGIALAAGVWKLMSVTIPAPGATAAGDNLLIYPYQGSSVILPAGATMDVTAAIVEKAPLVRPYFDGITNPATRINFNRNPRALTGNPGGQSWIYAAGTGEAGVSSYVVGAADGPVVSDGSMVASYRRYQVTTAKSAGRSGIYTRGTAGNMPTGAAGAVLAASMYVRVSVDTHVGLSLSPRLGGASSGSAVTLDPVDVPANVWTRLTGTTTTTAAWDDLQVYAVMDDDEIVPAGGRFDATAATIEITNTVGTFFDGATAATTRYSVSWAGTANASPSTLTLTDLYPSWSGTDSASTSVLRGTPPASYSTTSAAGAVRSTYWAETGTGVTSMRVIALPLASGAASTTSYAYMGNGTNGMLGTVPGHTYTLSARLHLKTAQAGTLSSNARKVALQYNSVSGTTGATTVAGTAAPNKAGTYTVSATATIPTGTVWVRALFYNGDEVGGEDVWYDEVILSEGETAAPYFDGSTPQVTTTTGRTTFAWTGTAHASTSTATTTVFSSMLQMTPTSSSYTASVTMAPDVFDATGTAPLAWASIPATSGTGVWVYGARIWAPVGYEVGVRPVLYRGPWKTASTPVDVPVPVSFVGDGTWHTIEAVFAPQTVGQWVGLEVSGTGLVNENTMILIDDIEVRAPTASGQPRECVTGAIMNPLSLCAAPYERNLYDAVCVDGPRIVETYQPDCGAMARVEFTIVAATPSPFGTARRVANLAADPASMTTYHEVECIPAADATVVERFQLAPNPGPTLDVGWLSLDPETWENVWSNLNPHTPGGASMVSTRIAPGGPYSTVLGAVTLAGAYGGDVTGLPKVQAGVTYTVSMWMRATAKCVARLEVQGFTTEGVVVGDVFVKNISAAANAWVKVSLTFTTVSGTDAIRVWASMQATSGKAIVGSEARFSELLVEQGTRIGLYFDGDSTSTDTTIDYEWAGEPGRSTSKMTQTVLTGPITDPGCPPVPAPPRPPVVEEGCVLDLDTYKRAMVTIPASAVPTWSDLVPIMNITAGKTSVRQLRVRFYPNPHGVPVEQLSVCGFVGEFIVSYLPASSTMTIDGITQQVVVVGPTGLSRKGNHLLYGSDGGPMVWPYMSCGSQYDLALDVDPAGAAVAFELCVAPRE